MSNRVVYDILDQQFGGWSFLFVAVCLGVFVFVLSLATQYGVFPSTLGRSKNMTAITGYVTALFILIFGMLGVFTSYQTFSGYKALRAAEVDAVVEGCIEDFSPKITRSRGELESFSVDGRRFVYSGGQTNTGFQQTVAEGGPMREGLYLRVHYYGNVILKLEIVAEECKS